MILTFSNPEEFFIWIWILGCLNSEISNLSDKLWRFFHGPAFLENLYILVLFLMRRTKEIEKKKASGTWCLEVVESYRKSIKRKKNKMFLILCSRFQHLKVFFLCRAAIRLLCCVANLKLEIWWRQFSSLIKYSVWTNYLKKAVKSPRHESVDWKDPFSLSWRN